MFSRLSAYFSSFWIILSTISNFLQYAHTTCNLSSKFLNVSSLVCSLILCTKYCIKIVINTQSHNYLCETINLILTFLCWWLREFCRFRWTKVYQMVLQPSIVSSESRCLDVHPQTLYGEMEVDRMEIECLWLSPQSLHIQLKYNNRCIYYTVSG